MSLWIRYDPVRASWEVSPNETEHYFADLLENHPRETRFDRWIELKAFADSKVADALFRPTSSPVTRRVKLYTEGDLERFVRRRRMVDDVWGPSQVDTMPAVAPAGSARLVFDRITNRLKLSQNGGEYYDVVPSVLNQQSATTIPLKIKASGGGSAYNPQKEPTDISNLTAWFKAGVGAYKDAGITLASDTETVQQWNDQSGNGRHLSQATSASRPTYRTSQLNGLSTLKFDGSDDQLTSSAAISNFIAIGAGTVMVVAKVIAVTTNDGNWQLNDQVWCDTSSNGRVGIGLRVTDNPKVASFTWNGGFTPIGFNVSPVGTWYIFTWMLSSGVLYFGESDTRTASMASGSAPNPDTNTGFLRLGASGFSSPVYTEIDIAEAALFSVAVSEADRKSLEARFASRYGLSVPYANGASDVDMFLIVDNNGTEMFRVDSTGDIYVRGTKLNVP